MQRILSVAQMREMDRKAIDELGLPGVCLMENAGRGCALAVIEELDQAGGSSVLVCCGPGNNGGDGYVIARCLANEGVDVRVLAVSPAGGLSGDAATMRAIVERMDLPLADLGDEFDPELLGEFLDVDLVVDALLGTGSKGAPRGSMAELIQWLAGEDLPIVSVDIPSGVCGDTGGCQDPHLMATRTVTMAAPKRGHLLPPGRFACGILEVADIGFLPEDLEAGDEWLTLEQHDLLAMLPERSSAGHKGVFGKVLVLAGSPGMAGAAKLCCRSILRAGAGMVRLASDTRVIEQLAGGMPEIMTQALDTAKSAAEQRKALAEVLEWADLLVVGPGLGQATPTMELVRLLVAEAQCPILLDADGINAFAGDAGSLGSHRSPMCITPHVGEFDRLVAASFADEAARIEAARDLAGQLDCMIVLKSAGSAILDPGGQVIIDATGSNALATAGSGDVLCGVIAGLAAQSRAWLPAAALGVHLHALAGELAAKELGARSVVSPDLLRHLPAAFRDLEKDPHEGHHHH